MHVYFRAATHANESPRFAQVGYFKLTSVLILVGLLIAVGAVLKFAPWNSGSATGATDGKGKANVGPREVDFGFIELNPEKPIPITSYKYGGNMVLYAGEELHYQVVGDTPLPPIELRVGEGTQALPGTDGKLQVAGPANTPLPASMVAQGSRLSLPGGAPPRVSVKVQVQGEARPTK